MDSSECVTVVGGGLAGSEAAWQIARRGVAVRLYEMRPVRPTAVHRTDRLAELYETGMMDVTEKNRKQILAWIDGLKTRAATNIYDSLELAFKLGTKASPVKPKGVPDTIFLVSDGAPTVGKYVLPDVILEHVKRWNKRRRIKIHAIGVGADHDIEFLQTLAETHGGLYVAR